MAGTPVVTDMATWSDLQRIRAHVKTGQIAAGAQIGALLDKLDALIADAERDTHNLQGTHDGH